MKSEFEKARDLKPKKDHYIDEDELSNEYCSAMKCTACFGIDQNGEPNGYGCPEQEQFLDDNYELILDFQEAYFLLDKKLDQQAKIIAELKGAFEYMRKVERQSGDVILYRNDKSLCEETLATVKEMELKNAKNRS